MTAIAVPGQLITFDKTGLATDAKLDDIITALGSVATESTVADILADTNTLAGKDFATEVTAAAILADTTAIKAIDFATETTLQKIREWPYATYNAQRLTQGALTDTWEFLNGATVVGTIVITYTVANGPIDNVAYSPALAV